jgi:predicted Rdx family selenoprotein
VAELKSWLDGHDVTFELIEGSNSVFDVECNGETVFEKAHEGRFPLYHEIQLRIFRKFLSAENLIEATQEKWDRILEAKGLTWDQVLLANGERERDQ